MPYEKLCEVICQHQQKDGSTFGKRQKEKVNTKISKALAEKHSVFEGKLAYLLSLHMPDRSNLLVANSMPIRDLEWFGQKNAQSKTFGIASQWNRYFRNHNGQLTVPISKFC